MKRFATIAKALMRVRGAWDRGMVTAEHAVGTVAVVGLGATVLWCIRHFPGIGPMMPIEFTRKLVEWIMSFWS